MSIETMVREMTEKHIQEMYDLRNRTMDRVLEILNTEDDWEVIMVKLDCIRTAPLFPLEEKK